MVIFELTKAAGKIAAMILLSPFLLIAFLAVLIYFAILDWMGKIRESSNPWHDEWIRHQQRRDYDRAA